MLYSFWFSHFWFLPQLEASIHYRVFFDGVYSPLVYSTLAVQHKIISGSCPQHVSDVTWLSGVGRAGESESMRADEERRKENVFIWL